MRLQSLSEQPHSEMMEVVVGRDVAKGLRVQCSFILQTKDVSNNIVNGSCTVHLHASKHMCTHTLTSSNSIQ